MIISKLAVVLADANASLSGVKGPNFSNSILDKAVLSGNFINANFTNVHAHEANAANARFEGATMKDADFSFSILSSMISLELEDQYKEAKLFGVKFE